MIWLLFLGLGVLFGLIIAAVAFCWWLTTWRMWG